MASGTSTGLESDETAIEAIDSLVDTLCSTATVSVKPSETWFTPVDTRLSTNTKELEEEASFRADRKSRPAMEFSMEYVYTLRRHYVEKIRGNFEKLIAKNGDVSAAPYFSSIKDLIADIYRQFVRFPSEEGFLHVVGLLHASVVKNKWKQYSDAQIRAINGALEICLKRSEISMKDVSSLSKQMAGAGIDSLPVDSDPTE
jgi:hypothetical protein